MCRDDHAGLPCRICDCNHDGCIPGFDAGECHCHSIGGLYITQFDHEYEPIDLEDLPEDFENACTGR